MPLDVKSIGFALSERSCTVTLPMEKEEQIYRFGLTPTLFNMTGCRVNLRPTDSPENPRGESHAPVPFYVSTRGYGVLVDTARYTQFFCGPPAPTNADEALAEASPAPLASPATPAGSNGAWRTTMLVSNVRGVDVYVFGGPALVDAVKRYNLFSGGGAVPPLWGLGMWYRGAGNFSAKASEELAKTFRDQNIPCDVWGVEPGWQTKTYSCSFVWSRAFPDPDGFIRRMHDMGFRLNFWEHAFTHGSSPIFEDLKPWSGNRRVWDGLVPDFAMPEARKVFLAHHEQVLFSKGADGTKLDECDHQPYASNRWSFPDDTVFPSGLNGEQMHSLFGVLYQQAMLEPLKKRNLRTWGLVRNSHALAAALPYGVYSDSYHHRGYLRGLLNEGFSGLLWVPEIRDCASVEDLYRRIQTVIFSPVAQIDCWYMKSPPWLQIDKDKNNSGNFMANRDEVTAVVRRLFELRMSLIPYLYSAFNEYRDNGTPPVRALVMDWPEDPQTHRVDDQFMVSPSLMVAPMFAGQAKRNVDLPKGRWHNYWTREVYDGGRGIETARPVDQVPIYVKDDSLLPLAKPVSCVKNDTCFELTVQVYGSKPAAFTLFEDDGISYDFEKGVQNRIKLSWVGDKGSLKKAGDYRGPARYKVLSFEVISGAGIRVRGPARRGIDCQVGSGRL